MTTTKAKLAALLAGPKKSDRAIRAELGLSQTEALSLVDELRSDLGITALVSLRDALRARGSK